MELQMLAPSEYCQIERDPTRYYHTPVLGRMYRSRVLRGIAELPVGHSVLDIGYGSGVAFINLAQKFNEIHGIDIHDRSTEVARSFDSFGLNLSLRQGSIFELPYEDNSLDAAIAISLHEHLPPDMQQRAFAEVHRVLKPGGCYVVGVPGVHALMTAAFGAMGWNINLQHICTHMRVLDEMRNNFDVDTETFWPSFFPKRYTAYVTVRGRK